MPSWADPIVGVAIVVVIGLVAPLIVLGIGKALAGKDHPMKRQRFESGNPPVGNGRGFFSMQYYPYLLMFLIVEPFAVFLLYLVMPIQVYPAETLAAAFSGIVVMLLAVRRVKSVVER